VTATLGTKPIIKHIVHFFKSLNIPIILVVVGYAKESVMTALTGEKVEFVEQKEQLGTGDALAVAVKALPETVTDVFVVYGDDGVIYNPGNRQIIEELYQKHLSRRSAITFLTIELDNPTGLGRIVRDSRDTLQAIVEEKDATAQIKQIKEINPGTFMFQVDFLRKYLSQIEKSPVTGEYYLTSLIDIALKHGEKIETLKGGKLAWRGVNTPEELNEANKIFREIE